jgi:dCMP deaminase
MIKKDKAEKYYQLAQNFAELFSKDPSRKVGALCLHPESLAILSQGYNGFPRGVDEIKPERWEKPMKYRWIEHAERNCIYNACRHGTGLDGTIAVVTMFPCADCARALIQAGVRTLVTMKPDMSDPRWGSEFQISLEMFQEVGMVMLYVDPKLSSEHNHSHAGNMEV